MLSNRLKKWTMLVLLIAPLLFLAGSTDKAWPSSDTMQYSCDFLGTDDVHLPPEFQVRTTGNASIQVLDGNAALGGVYRLNSGTNGSLAQLTIGTDQTPSVRPFAGGKTTTMIARVRVQESPNSVMLVLGFWRNPTSSPPSWTDFGELYCNSTQNQGRWKAWIFDDQKTSQFPMGAGYNTSISPSASTWQELKIVLTSTTATFYIDGVQQHQFTTSGNPSEPVPNDPMAFYIEALATSDATVSGYIEIDYLEITQSR